jgi:hypothetical protein
MLIYYTISVVRRHGQDKSENGLCLFFSSTLKSFEKWRSPLFGAKITSYIYLLIFTISLWLHFKHFIALTKRESVRRILFCNYRSGLSLSTHRPVTTTQMSFIYCHLNFHANLSRTWPFPLKKTCSTFYFMKQKRVSRNKYFVLGWLSNTNPTKNWSWTQMIVVPVLLLLILLIKKNPPLSEKFYNKITGTSIKHGGVKLVLVLLPKTFKKRPCSWQVSVKI